MRKSSFLLIIFALLTAVSFAQEKKISLEEIWGGTFRTEGLDVLRSMKNGTQYTVLNFNRATGTRSIDKYDYKTQQKVSTIVSSSEEIPPFSSYEFSDDESKIILATQVEPIFRRSRLGVYYVYDIKSNALTKIAEEKIQEPELSPDGSKVAYVSSDGTKIAFLRFDETNVPNFSMDVYGKELYQTQNQFKYPKAGEENAKVSLHMYDVAGASLAAINLGEAYYIPRIKWMNNPNYLSVQTINRHQNHLKILLLFY